MKDKKSAIFQAARERFYTKGYKDTNISDITALAGVSVGTFYNYYDSKERIFLDVYTQENEVLTRKIMASTNPDDDPITYVAKFMALDQQEIINNRILKEWYNKELFAKLEQHFTETGEIHHIDELVDESRVRQIELWKARGQMRSDIDTDMILALIKSVTIIDAHKQDIGIQHFPQLINHLADFIMIGLTTSPPTP